MQIDQRTHQTHRKLMTALQAHFTAQMPFNKLTVKQLCHDAHVGRATFYRHHQDIADIIVVEYLITLQELGHALNNLENPTYATIAGAIITTMRTHLDLPSNYSPHWQSRRHTSISSRLFWATVAINSLANSQRLSRHSIESRRIASSFSSSRMSCKHQRFLPIPVWIETDRSK